MLTIILTVVIFGAIVLLHELGHFLAAKRSGVAVSEFSVGMGPALFSRQRAETTYVLRLLPVGGYVLMEGEEGEEPGQSANPAAFCNQPHWRQLVIIAAGAVTNLLMGYLILVLLVAMTGYVGTTVVSSFGERSASAQVLQAGDKIVRINGHRVRTANDVSYELMKDQDGLVEMTVERDGEQLALPPIQFALEDLGDGIQTIRMDFRLVGKPAGFFDLVTYPVNWGISICKQVWYSLWGLATGVYDVNQISGPVGVSTMVSQAKNEGWDTLLLLVAILAINIGIFNLLPLPMLDGGKLVLILFEAATGIRVGEKIQTAINMAGMVMLVGLMLYVTYHDILKLVTGGASL